MSMPTQLGIPVHVHEDELARKKTLGDALELCAELAGYSRDKETSIDIGVDKAQLSRWKSGGEGIMWPKFEKLMDVCGNDAPLMWLANSRGYGLVILKTEAERLAEAAERALEEERSKVRLLTDLLKGKAA